MKYLFEKYMGELSEEKGQWWVITSRGVNSTTSKDGALKLTEHISNNGSQYAMICSAISRGEANRMAKIIGDAFSDMGEE